jgi:hypothetical protein
MKFKNVSDRGWTTNGVMIAPGAVVDIDDKLLVDIKGVDDLVIVEQDEKPTIKQTK